MRSRSSLSRRTCGCPKLRLPQQPPHYGAKPRGAARDWPIAEGPLRDPGRALRQARDPPLAALTRPSRNANRLIRAFQDEPLERCESQCPSATLGRSSSSSQESPMLSNLIRRSLAVGVHVVAHRPSRRQDTSNAKARARASHTTAVAAAATLAGCMVGPDYERPPAAVPDAWIDARGPSAPPAESTWWQQFHDTKLDRLVAEAVSQNPRCDRPVCGSCRPARCAASRQTVLSRRAAAASVAPQRSNGNTPLGGTTTPTTAHRSACKPRELDFWASSGAASSPPMRARGFGRGLRRILIACRRCRGQLRRSPLVAGAAPFTRANVQAQQDTLN